MQIRWGKEQFLQTFSKRQANSHKGTYGKGLLIGGSKEMIGSVMLSSKAALRSGIGLLTTAVPEEIFPIVGTHCLETMYAHLSSENGRVTGECTIDFNSFDGIGIGPGLGREQGAKSLVKKVMEVNVPLVIDADGLFHLVTYIDEVKSRKNVTILTPHEGEFSRLLNKPVSEVHFNRSELSRFFAMEYGVYLVLKGPQTIVTTPTGEQYINSSGNEGLAKGGSGDVLTGMILAFLLHQKNAQAAISNAVFLHGACAEYLLNTHTTTDIIASDIIDTIPNALRDLLK